MAKRWLAMCFGTLALLFSLVGTTQAAHAASFTPHVSPAVGCPLYTLGNVGLATNDGGVPGTIYAKVYEQKYYDPDTGFCDFHYVFAEATWQSNAGGAPSSTIYTYLYSCNNVQYQNNNRNIGGLTEGSIDTAQSSRGDSAFVGITKTSWSTASVSTGCVSVR